MPYQDQSVMLQKYVVRIFLVIFVSFTNLLSPYLIFPLFNFLVAFNDNNCSFTLGGDGYIGGFYLTYFFSRFRFEPSLEYPFKILKGSHRKIFKVCFSIFHRYAWKG